MKAENHINVTIYSLAGEGCVVEYSLLTVVIDDDGKTDGGCGGSGEKAFSENADAVQWVADWIADQEEADQTSVEFKEGTVISSDRLRQYIKLEKQHPSLF